MSIETKTTPLPEAEQRRLAALAKQAATALHEFNDATRALRVTDTLYDAERMIGQLFVYQLKAEKNQLNAYA
jgi:hypothetical protein